MVVVFWSSEAVVFEDSTVAFFSCAHVQANNRQVALVKFQDQERFIHAILS
jgi:hypothetical protein